VLLASILLSSFMFSYEGMPEIGCSRDKREFFCKVIITPEKPITPTRSVWKSFAN
jgi:hypothetical protein